MWEEVLHLKYLHPWDKQVKWWQTDIGITDVVTYITHDSFTNNQLTYFTNVLILTLL